MTNDIVDRITALEADVAHLKQNSITREDIGQLLVYLSRMDANIASISSDTSRIRGDVSQLNSRVQRLEENASVLPELSTKVEAIGNDIKRLAQEM
jgi:outer membrane murein-binding lipoprotein Lpp